VYLLPSQKKYSARKTRKKTEVTIFLPKVIVVQCVRKVAVHLQKVLEEKHVTQLKEP
jgi:hypothetical protein